MHMFVVVGGEKNTASFGIRLNPEHKSFNDSAKALLLSLTLSNCSYIFGEKVPLPLKTIGKNNKGRHNQFWTLLLSLADQKGPIADKPVAF